MLHELSLDGAWQLRWTDGERGRAEHAYGDETDEARCLDATVPGEVHLDLMRAGLIGEPCEGLNALAARWVEETVWVYRKVFDAPAAAMRGRCWLHFEMLDLAATVVLNGEVVGSHCNAFRPARFEVTGKLRRRGNVLAVRLESGLFHVADKPGGPWGNYLSQHLTKRQWLRKPQCQFGWDWAPRLLNVGIQGSAALQWTGDPVRIDQFVPLAEVTDDLQDATVRARLFVDGLSDAPRDATLTVEIDGGPRVVAAATIRSGSQVIEAVLHVPTPKLWWPVGCGKQHRYRITATLSIAGKTIGTREARIGFRHVRVNQDPHPVKGRYFVLEINGRQVFAKGGNFVPADIILARIDRDRYDKLTDLALEANCNLLRVWGGGLYESDDFYDLCDEKGILVWQEFIFACSRYPGTDAAFLDEVRAEARHQVRRLAEHPSLIIWCGNNEMEQGAWDWGYDRGPAPALPDYALFHLHLPRIVHEEDPTRYYQPSSPYSPDDEHPLADHTGDQHPWSIGFHDTDFRKYRDMICRFPNEGGILGSTALPTMLACLPEGPALSKSKGQRHVASFAWQQHDNSVDSWADRSPPDEMIRQWLDLDPRKMSVEAFTYWAGLLHGEGLREYIDNFRRRMFDSAAAIFWMYNDTWPAVRSWTIVDYYLRRTPAFWAVKRAMAPISVVLALHGEEVVVHGVNDTDAAVVAELRHGVMQLSGGYPLDLTATVTLAPNASTPLARFPMSRWRNPRRSMAFATLTKDGRLLARNRLYLPRFHNMTWPRAKVHVRLANGRATFTSDTFTWGVCLDLDGDRPLADNFFDLYPGVPYELPWRGKSPPKILAVGNLV